MKWAWVVALSLVASVANAAEPSPEDRALATELFKQGRELMGQGRFDQACGKLEESQRLDPGGGTLLNVAACHEGQGRTATAWSEYHEVVAWARRDGRQDRLASAQARIEAIGPSLARLVITVTPNAWVDGFLVRRDGSDVGRAAWGVGMPIDPGEHEVVATAPGRKAWRSTVKVRPGERIEVVVPILAAAAPVLVRGGRGARVEIGMGIALGALGIGSVAVGSYFGLRAIARRHDSDTSCQDGCSSEGVLLNEQAKTAADVSTLLFVAGAFAVAGGLYLALDGRARLPRSEDVGLVSDGRGVGVSF